MLLLGVSALAACAAPYGPGGGYPIARVPLAGAPPGGGRPVALLLPLSGARAELGQAMLKAAQLALASPDSPRLDVRDTAGTAAGAEARAREAIAGGATMILGPLTSVETAAVAPIARAVGVPVLAFTNDPAQAAPGVWPLGITPRQQVLRLSAAAREEGRSRFAALLPDTDFGRAMAISLQDATAAAGLEPPRIQQYARGMAAISAAARELADYGARGGGLEARIRAARERGDAREAAELARQRGSVPPPPFDALLLADTGEPLSEIVSLLPYYDISPSAVRILGPALWATSSSGSGQLPGAWYAAPDPAARAGFADAFAARYGAPPPIVADLAFDAASIARVLGPGGEVATVGLTQPGGFAGTDGLFALQPDGRVRRALAVFAVQRGGSQLVAPAPASLGAPGV